MKIVSVFLISVAIFFAGCSQYPLQPLSDNAKPIEQKFVLRVALYPWIPESESFFTWIERSFEAKNPDIDLVVRPMSKANKVDLSYDIKAARSALGDANSEDYQHLVEIDTLILGSLVKGGGIIQPFFLERHDYFDFAKQAVEIDGRFYGVPHWSCGNFLITTIDSVANAGSAKELRAALVAQGSAYPDLAGDLIGSWSSVVTYLDAYVDTYPGVDLAEALNNTNLDTQVSDALAAVGSACTSSGAGLCDRNDAAIVKEFAAGRLDALIGYSERLNPIFADPDNQISLSKVHITPAPLGVGKTAFLFTDALVLSSACSSRRCVDAAKKFAEFYVSDAVMESSMKSTDGGASAVPRYLLPSTRSAINRVIHDPIYRQLAPILSTARPYPNQGVPEARERGAIKSAVDTLIHPTP